MYTYFLKLILKNLNAIIGIKQRIKWNQIKKYVKTKFKKKQTWNLKFHELMHKNQLNACWNYSFFLYILTEWCCHPIFSCIIMFFY